MDGYQWTQYADSINNYWQLNGMVITLFYCLAELYKGMLQVLTKQTKQVHFPGQGSLAVLESGVMVLFRVLHGLILIVLSIDQS